MTEKCFICLKSTKNRVCSSCTCSAHLRCWYMYCDTKPVIQYWIYDVEIPTEYDVPDSNNYPIDCPICKKKIERYCIFTRSMTIEAKGTILKILVEHYIKKMKKTRSLLKKKEYLYFICRQIVTHKNIYKSVCTDINNGSIYKQLILFGCRSEQARLYMKQIYGVRWKKSKRSR